MMTINQREQLLEAAKEDLIKYGDESALENYTRYLNRLNDAKLEAMEAGTLRVISR